MNREQVVPWHPGGLPDLGSFIRQRSAPLSDVPGLVSLPNAGSCPLPWGGGWYASAGHLWVGFWGGAFGLLWRQGWVMALPGVVLKDVGVGLNLGAKFPVLGFVCGAMNGLWFNRGVLTGGGHNDLHVVDHCGSMMGAPGFGSTSTLGSRATRHPHWNPVRAPPRDTSRSSYCCTKNLDPRKGLTPTRRPHPTRQRSEKHPVPRPPRALSGVSRDHDDTQHEPQRALPQ